MPRPPDPAVRERIVAAATMLFAERGYAATTTRAIAAAVGMNIATVHYHFGKKFDLFSTVLEHLYQEESEVLHKSLPSLEEGSLTNLQAACEILADTVTAIIDLMASRPERPRLYLRRWLDPIDELRPLEARFSIATHRPLRDFLERAMEAGLIDPAFPIDTFLRSFSWIIYGYFATGPIDWKEWFSDPLDPNHLRDLRRLLQDYVRQSLTGAWAVEPAR